MLATIAKTTFLAVCILVLQPRETVLMLLVFVLCS